MSCPAASQRGGLSSSCTLRRHQRALLHVFTSPICWTNLLHLIEATFDDTCGHRQAGVSWAVSQALFHCRMEVATQRRELLAMIQ